MPYEKKKRVSNAADNVATTNDNVDDNNTNGHNNNNNNLEWLLERLSGFETEYGRLHGLKHYQPLHNDIIISTSPKSGTTWMQQICYQIRYFVIQQQYLHNNNENTEKKVKEYIDCVGNNGSPSSSSSLNSNMNFIEISQVVPWIELAYDQNQNLYDIQYGEEYNHNHTTGNNDEKNNNRIIIPRLFKTHAWYDHCPKSHKTIVVVRHPYDVVVSFYHFLMNWFYDTNDNNNDNTDEKYHNNDHDNKNHQSRPTKLPPIPPSLDEFISEFWLARDIPDDTYMQNASYFIHLLSWYQRKFHSNHHNTTTKTLSSSDDDDIKTDNDTTTNQNHDNNTIYNNDPNILFVFYEDLHDNLSYEISRIIQFMFPTLQNDNDNSNLNDSNNININDIVLNHVLPYTTYQYMKLHQNQFDEKLSKRARNISCGLHINAGMKHSKIRTGQYGLGINELSITSQRLIDAKWKEIIYPMTNCVSYNGFCNHMKGK